MALDMGPNPQLSDNEVTNSNHHKANDLPLTIFIYKTLNIIHFFFLARILHPNY